MKSELKVGGITVKTWGHEELWVNGPLYCSKRLHVKRGFVCSLHRHRVKHECFVVKQGTGWAIVDQKPYQLTEGAVLEVPAGAWHQFWCPANSLIPLILLEISTHHSEEDVERLTLSGPLPQLPNITSTVNAIPEYLLEQDDGATKVATTPDGRDQG